MKLQQYFNTTKEEIESNKYNIFIPICLGNKFFTDKNQITENVKSYLYWSLEHTKDKILFLVADKIQDTNYYVRNSNNTESQNLRMVLKEGKETKNNLEKLASKLPADKKEKVKIIRWNEYSKHDPYCYDTTILVYKKFKNNPEFKDKILNLVKTSVTDRKFSEEKYWRLCDYVLDEFSLCYSGIEYSEDAYNLMIYPSMDSVSSFLFEELIPGKIFPKLNKKLPEEKTALAIVN